MDKRTALPEESTPGQALPYVHMMICGPGATLPWVKFRSSNHYEII